MRLAWTVGFILALALGCAPRTELTPAPSAQRLSDRIGAALAEVAGVRVIVDPNQWTDSLPTSHGCSPSM